MTNLQCNTKFNNMKTQMFFGIVLTILLVSVRSEDDDDWKAEEENCVNELKLNKATIKTINKQELVPEDNSDFNNFLSCYWKKKNMQGEDGVIDFDAFHREFLVEFRKEFGVNQDIPTIIIGGLVKTAITDCKNENIKGSTDGETVAKLQNCVMKKVKKAVEEIDSSENV